MSIQSMKYHNLPTTKQIEAYNSGRMSSGERKWMDSMIKRNPFVKESVQAAKTADMAAVGRISSYMSTNVTAQYLTKVGFWSKYGGWISFSSFAVIIGLGVFFGPDLYNKYVLSENVMEVGIVTNGEIPAATIEDNSKESLETVSNSNSVDLKVVKTIETNDFSNADVILTELNEPNNENNAVAVTDPEIEDKETPEVINESTKAVNDLAPKATKLTVLSAKKVVISSKFDPDNKSSSNLPLYPGGDLALCDYFKSKIRAIQVPDAEKYSVKASILLQVSAKGKVMSSSIKGKIHPTHESALQTAIDNLPKFESGKSKAQYSIEVRF